VVRVTLDLATINPLLVHFSSSHGHYGGHPAQSRSFSPHFDRRKGNHSVNGSWISSLGKYFTAQDFRMIDSVRTIGLAISAPVRTLYLLASL
jgi:hypothetical protein